MAASRTSPPRSRDSACVTRLNCCAAAGRLQQRRANDSITAFNGPTTGTCICAMAQRSRMSCASPRSDSGAPSSCRISSRRSPPPPWRKPIGSASWRRCPADSRFEPLLTLYLTDSTSAAEIDRARAQRIHPRRQALSGRRHDAFGLRSYGHQEALRGTRAHAGNRHALAGSRRIAAGRRRCRSIAKLISSIPCSHPCSSASPSCPWCSNTSAPSVRSNS